MKTTFALFLLLISCAFGKISEVTHFKELAEYVDGKTLILLDIDDTLLIPCQMVGSDEWFGARWNHWQEKGLSFSEALEKTLAEWEGIRHLTRMHIVEPETDRIIKHLQDSGHCVMGLTTQGLALATRTYLQLQEQSIDLTRSSPCPEDCYFTLRQHGVLYRHGILFTSGTHKGEALFRFCESIDFSPERIVFINDKASHLKEIEGIAEKRGVEFVGLRYAYSDLKKRAFDLKVADYQFRHSTLDRLLSDEEAKMLMERK
jgi:hypothetical protein